MSTLPPYSLTAYPFDFPIIIELSNIVVVIQLTLSLIWFNKLNALILANQHRVLKYNTTFTNFPQARWVIQLNQHWLSLAATILASLITTNIIHTHILFYSVHTVSYRHIKNDKSHLYTCFLVKNNNKTYKNILKVLAIQHVKTRFYKQDIQITETQWNYIIQQFTSARY